MKKIINYDLVCSGNALIFTELINKKIKEGWELYGSTFLSPNAFCQSMVRYEGIDHIDH